MKAAIIYYSATGNTAKIAKAIHRGVQTELDCDLISIKKADPKDMGVYDLIIVGGPIWYYRETANLRLFIHKMPDMSGKYFAPFCTHGSAPEGFLFSISQVMKKKGMTLIGWNDWYGSVYQVMHMPKPYMTDGHPDDIDLEEGEKFGRETAVRAKQIAAGNIDLIPKQPTKKEDPLWGIMSVEMFAASTGNDGSPQSASIRKSPIRNVDRSKCRYPDCSLCIDTCPVNAIDFSAESAEFNKQCVDCMLCDKMCPELAIDVDEDSMKSRTQHIIKMDKCKYPVCTLCVDHCPMNSIDFSITPPVFKKNCEGDDLCWVICPYDAIEVTNLDTTHRRMIGVRESPGTQDHPFLRKLAQAEAAGKFRRHIPLDKIGWDNIVCDNPNAPRFIIDED